MNWKAKKVGDAFVCGAINVSDRLERSQEYNFTCNMDLKVSKPFLFSSIDEELDGFALEDEELLESNYRHMLERHPFPLPLLPLLLSVLPAGVVLLHHP